MQIDFHKWCYPPFKSGNHTEDIESNTILEPKKSGGKIWKQGRKGKTWNEIIAHKNKSDEKMKKMPVKVEKIDDVELYEAQFDSIHLDYTD